CARREHAGRGAPRARLLAAAARLRAGALSQGDGREPAGGEARRHPHRDGYRRRQPAHAARPRDLRRARSHAARRPFGHGRAARDDPRRRACDVAWRGDGHAREGEGRRPGHRARRPHARPRRAAKSPDRDALGRGAHHRRAACGGGENALVGNARQDRLPLIHIRAGAPYVDARGSVWSRATLFIYGKVAVASAGRAGVCSCSPGAAAAAETIMTTTPRVIFTLAFVTAALLATPSPSRATWQLNGNPICTA